MLLFVMTIHFISPVLPIYGMDSAPMLDDRMIAWKIILEHGVQWFSYRKIQSLAISKTHTKLLRDTTEYRKSYLCKQLNLKSDNLIWHKYGAMCGQMCFERKELYVRRFYLHKTAWHGQPARVCHGKFNQPLPHQPIAYFNNKSAFCYYMYYTNGQTGPINGRIYKQIFPSQRIPVRLGLYKEMCVTNIVDKPRKLIELKVFLEFPVLLKAFLKSHKVYEKDIDWWIYDCDVAKVYDIKGVTIPKNFKKHKPYFPTITYASFDDLPKVVRKAVVARYKEQGKK